MSYEDFKRMDYLECALKFTEGGGRDVCRLIWRIINKKNKKGLVVKGSL